MPDTLFKQSLLTLATTNPYDWELDKTNPINQGLVGAWCPSLGPSGSRLLDKSGYRNDATLVNTNDTKNFVTTNGKLAIEFDGINDYAVLPLKPTFRLLGNFAISVWVQNLDTANYGEIIRWDTTSTNVAGRSIIGIDKLADNTCRFVTQRNGTETTLIFSNSAIFSDTVKVYHICAIQNRSQVQLWVDGILHSSAASTTTFYDQTEKPFCFGAFDQSSFFLKCRLDDIRFWSRGITSAEVSQLYRGGRGYGYRPRQRVYAVGQATSDISGTSAITFSQSATLAGSGSLAGTASLTFSQSGDLKGSAAAVGSAAVMFSDSSTLTASGALVGSAALAFDATGTASSGGALAASAAVAFGSSATATGSGALAGSAGVAFGDAADLVGSGLLGGAVGLAFTASATGFVYAAIQGSTSIQFSASATPFRGLKTQRPRKLSITSHRNNLGITTHGKNLI